MLGAQLERALIWDVVVLSSARNVAPIGAPTGCSESAACTDDSIIHGLFTAAQSTVNLFPTPASQTSYGLPWPLAFFCVLPI
jgi:hypothetical protein